MSGHTALDGGGAARQGKGRGSALARGAAALACGTVFGLGLAVAQMVDPRKVLAFLDVTGAWDASLLFVLGAAVMLAGIGFALLRRRTRPLLDAGFHPPAATALDAPLIVGSALFGIGWGLAGYCPGPAIASLGFGNAEALWFVPAMLVGIALRRWTAVRR
jgi:uncharacterized membrane protein YedE/YeeE